MAPDLFHSQIKARRDNDTRMFEQALSDLASILSPRSAEQLVEVKGAVAEIVAALGGRVPEIPADVEDLNLQLEHMLRPTGILRRRVVLAGRWWKDAVGCYLGSTDTGHAVAILPGKAWGYAYRGPDGHLVRVDRRTARHLNTDAFCFYRPLPERKLGVRDLVRFMLGCITAADVTLTLGASLLVALLGLFLPFMNQVLFERVIPGGVNSMLAPVAALLLGVAVASTLIGMTRGVILDRLQGKFRLAVQSAAMMRLLSLPATFFKEHSAGDLSSRLTGVHALCATLSNATLTVGLTALFSIVYLVQMGSFCPALTGPAVLILLVSLGHSLLSTGMQLGVSRRRLKISAVLNGRVFAIFSGIQKIKLAGAEKRAFAQWAKVYREEGKLVFTPPVYLRLNAAVTLLISGLGAVWLYGVAGAAKVSAADYIAFQVAYGAVAGALQALSGIAAAAAEIRPVLEMVQPLLETVPESSSERRIVTSLSGGIEINNLTFRYDKDGPAILHNLSLKVRPGEFVAVVGKTGCGKSTLLRMLLGFERPESGAVYYDGNNLESLDMRSFRRCVGTALQNGRLLAGSIFSNIVLAAPWLTMQDAWEAARLAGVSEDIQAMPMGMHTLISEGSGGISGGQRQRILIARAIAPRPAVLFFDEATSALDNLSQKRVIDKLESLACTRLVIAHRLSTLCHSDRIVVLEGGRIVEEGTYEELMNAGGPFQELAARQTL